MSKKGKRFRQTAVNTDRFSLNSHPELEKDGHSMNRHKFTNRTVYMLIAVVVCAVSLMRPGLASAYSSDDINSMLNGTPFFDPNASACSGTSTGDVGTAQVDATGNNPETAYNFFVANGFNPAQAAGIVGNLVWESGGVDPTKWQDGGGGGYGIAQWTPPTAMIAWVNANSGDPNSLGGTKGKVGQLDYLLHDLKTNNSGVYSQIHNDSTVVASTTDFMNGYERPGQQYANLTTRIADAQAIYQQYSGNSNSGTTTSAGNCANAGGPVDAAGCSNPWAQAKNLSPERIDMGVDYNADGGSPILAICPGKVIGVAAGGTGWSSPLNTQACVYIQISSGTYSGKSYYVCEDIAPTVKVGDTVTAGQEIATFLKSSTGLETGWGTGTPFGALAAKLDQECHNGDPGCWATAVGVSFNKLIVATGGKSGVFVPGAPQQSVPAGYP